MSRNGAGVYSLPAGNPVVTGTTISSTWANTSLSDIATALTQSLAKDGQTVPTANIPLGGFKITGLGAPTVAGDALAYGSSLGAVTATTGTFSGNVQMASANGGQLAGLRNKIINGNMLVNQRGATASAITGSSAYYLDRWIAVTNTTPSGTLTVGQQTVAVSEATSSNACLRLAKTAGTYLGQLVTAQAFESGTSWGLAGKTVTISFKARKGSSYTGAALPIVIVRSGTGLDQSAALLTSNAWTGAAQTIVSLTGTLTTSMSDFSGTATIPASATQVGVVVISNYATATTGSANDYLDITDVQLEVGPVATPFEQRPIGMELALCQRYYIQFQASNFFGSGQLRTGGLTSYGLISTPVQMRVSPTATPNTGGVYVGDTQTAYTSLGINSAQPNGIFCAPTFATAAGTVKDFFMIINGSSAVGLSAEL